MKKRKDEFIKEREDISITAMRAWPADVLAKWLIDWGNYISSGGTRPPKPR